MGNILTSLTEKFTVNNDFQLEILPGYTLVTTVLDDKPQQWVLQGVDITNPAVLRHTTAIRTLAIATKEIWFRDSTTKELKKSPIVSELELDITKLGFPTNYDVNVPFIEWSMKLRAAAAEGLITFLQKVPSDLLIESYIQYKNLVTAYLQVNFLDELDRQERDLTERQEKDRQDEQEQEEKESQVGNLSQEEKDKLRQQVRDSAIPTEPTVPTKSREELLKGKR